MKMLRVVASVALLAPALSLAQGIEPFSPDSPTRGLWHFDETAGVTLFDASPWGNNGLADGTVVVAGRFGNARSFNGLSNSIVVPPNKAFDFDTSSFQIDIWFKTDHPNGGVLLRRGLVPIAGYTIALTNGRLVGQIGSREDRPWPDTVITIWSDSTYNDGLWHLATLVRDRSARKLFLYADNKLAAQPADDPFTLPLSNDRPLVIGRWENEALPYHFNGVIDEVRLTSQTIIPGSVVIHVQPALLDFGFVRTGSAASRLLTVSNTGYRDTLRIASVTSSNPRFVVPVGSILIPAGKSMSMPVSYSPFTGGSDTGMVSISSNDPVVPTMYVRLQGKAHVLGAEPMIADVGKVPNTNLQLRVRWFRSVYDTASAVDPVTEYSIWRSIPGANLSAVGGRPDSYPLPSSGAGGPHWEFISTVPALGFDEYSCIVPAVVDLAKRYTPNILMVAGRTRNLLVYFSGPDTVLVDGSGSTGIGRYDSLQVPREFSLAQNYPNPFNPTTNIRLTIVNRQLTIIKVFDVLGREVAVLVNEVKEPGTYTLQFDGSHLSSGVYYCQLQAGRYVETKKLLLLR